MKLDSGKNIYNLCKRLWPITRSITGDGVRETLGIIQKVIPDLTIHEVPTGTRCFDWEIPREWNIQDAYIVDPNGKKIVDFQDSNLHVVSYSTPVNQIISLSELQQHLYSIPEQPNAIPYVTSYYQERWGFCLTENQRKTLKEGDYQVYIDSELSDGSLTYGELIIPGKSEKEVFLSTYVCHPSMANNELSGPTVTTYLAKWIQSQPREYTYRIIFIPETIGSICYLSQNFETMKKNIVAGYNISCVGDDNSYSYLPSRDEDTISDKIALHILKHTHPDFTKYTYLDRGSDERQYCSPGVDLPISSVMRTKYGAYKEYHTSLDNLDYISPEGLFGAYEVLTKCIDCIENNKTYKATTLCEPQMGRRNLRSTLGVGTNMAADVMLMSNILAYADGSHDVLSMAEKFNVPMFEMLDNIDILIQEGLIEMVEKSSL
jgi:aminopeptidase-like protein